MTRVRVSLRIACGLVLVAAVSGCGNPPDARPARAVQALLAGRPLAWRTLMMPRHVRSGDFDFACDGFSSYRIDSRVGTYSWLHGDSTDRPNVALLTLSSAERDSVWSWLLDADYFDMPRESRHVVRWFIPAGVESKLEVRVGDARYSAEVHEGFAPLAVQRPNQLTALEALCERINRLVKQEPAVRRLPGPFRRRLQY